MSVPDNWTYGLQDVATEIFGSYSGYSQQDCVNNAVESGYDPAYSSEVGLKKFRNYTHSYWAASVSELMFSNDGGTDHFHVSASMGWYVVADTSEIDFYFTSTSFSAGDVTPTVVVSAGEVGYTKYADNDCYDSVTDAYLGTLSMSQGL